MNSVRVPFAYLCLFSCLVLVPCNAAESIRVMTFNIRYGTAPDGDNAWPLRKDLALQVVEDFGPQLLGLQEALRTQLAEFLQRFPHYSSLGPGRDADGGGEYSALLYDQRRFDVLSFETIWLSETPAVRGSHTWGNELPRICTMARLADRTSGQVLRVINTHWDHQSQSARFKGSELIAGRIQQGNDAEPVLTMGDFNAGPSNPARQTFTDIGLRDSYAVLHPDDSNASTFNGFGHTNTSDKIDAILISDQWQVLQAEIIRIHEGNRYPSDHYPVTATLQLRE